MFNDCKILVLKKLTNCGRFKQHAHRYELVPYTCDDFVLNLELQSLQFNKPI